MKYLQVAQWPVWRPATAWMRQLRFPAKMALISGAFLLPLAWLVTHFLVDGQERVAQTAQERHGVAYARAAFAGLAASDHWRFARRGAAYGDADAPVASARQAFVQGLEALRLQQQAHGQRWPLGDAWQALEAAVAQADKLPNGDPQAIYQGMLAIDRALAALLAAVTDHSGLALDPEFATYYVMSAALMHGPEVVQRTAELRGLAGGALRAGRIEPTQSQQLAALVAVVQHHLAAARGDLDKAGRALAASPRALTTDAPQVTQAYLARVSALFQPGESAVQGDARALIAQANQVLAAQFAQIDKNLAVLDGLLADRQAALQQRMALTLGITLAGLAVALFLAMGFYRSMLGGFKSLRRHVMAISMGDLRAEIRSDGHDEVSDLLREVRHMQAALRQTVQRVQHASDAVVQASLEIASGTQDLSSRTEAAAAALEQSSAALEQTTSSVGQTADSARQASDIAVDNARVAERGGQVMHQVVQTMERIQGSSRRIADIIGTIDGIAFQTNILALNAAVEAARAGEQGRGFAVVAGEVRSLAQRSAEAAKEIRGLITSSVEDVDGGMDVVRSAGDTMREIVTNADQVRQLLDLVAHGAREQTLGIGQIGEAVQELDRSTQANASLVEQTAGVARTQRQAAVTMAAQVDEFRLPGALHQPTSQVEGIDVDTIIDAHRQWKVKLREAIDARARVDTATLSRDDCCALGKWIYGDGQRLAGRPSFSDLITRHQHFHRVAGGVGELINRAQYREAEDALAPGTPFSQATSDVALVLSSAKRLGF